MNLAASGGILVWNVRQSPVAATSVLIILTVFASWGQIARLLILPWLYDSRT